MRQVEEGSFVYLVHCGPPGFQVSALWTGFVKVSLELYAMRGDLIAKSDEVKNVRHDWDTERATFLAEALRDHVPISVEEDGDTARRISI